MRNRFFKGLKLFIKWIFFLAVIFTGTTAVYHYTMLKTERNVLEASIVGDTCTEVSGKLVLVAHSIAGMYADFWACSYPAEVAGIVYIDATLPEIYAEQGEEPFALKTASLAKTAGSFTGLQRILVGDSTLIRRDYKGVFSSRDQDLRRMLMYANTWSPATFREKCAAYQNAVAALAVRKQAAGFAAVPKLYFEADTYHGEYFESVAAAGVKVQYGFTDDAQLAEWVAGADERRQAEYQQIEALGNVTLVKVSGPHTLYEYAPDTLSEKIAAFVESITIKL